MPKCPAVLPCDWPMTQSHERAIGQQAETTSHDCGNLSRWQFPASPPFNPQTQPLKYMKFIPGLVTCMVRMNMIYYWGTWLAQKCRLKVNT